MGRVSFAALVLIPLLLLAPPARAGSIECGLFADSLLADTDTLSRFYPVRLGVPGQELIWRDLEFMWDSLYTSGSGPSISDRIKMFTFAENLVRVRGKNPFSPGPGDDYSDFHLAYEFFRASGGSYTQAPGDTTSVVLGNFDRLSQPLSSYNPSDRSHLDVYLVHPNHLDPSPGDGRLYSTSPSEFIEGDEDLSTNRQNDPKQGNSIQVVMEGVTSSADTLWTSHDHIWARTVVHEMQHGFPSTDRAPAVSEMFSQGTEVVVGMTQAASAEANNSEIPFPWGVFAYGFPLDSCGQVTQNVGLNYELRSLFTAYLAFNLQGSDNTLADDLLRQWARSARGKSDLRRLLRNDSCVTCSTTNYFPAGPGGSALDDKSRLNLLIHNFRVALYANDTTLAQGQYGYPPRFGFVPTDHFRCWQDFDGCIENDIVALPPEIVVGSGLIAADTVLVGTRAFRNNTARIALQPYGAEYWVLRSAPELFGTSRTLRIRVAPEGLCNQARLTASLIGYSPPDDSVLTGALWANPQWATVATTPVWIDTDSLRNPLELTLAGFGTQYKAAVLVITLGDGPELIGNLPRLDYRATIALSDRLYAPSAPVALNPTTTFHESTPTWSPAGDELAFMRRPDPSGTTQVYRQKLDGSSLVPLTASSPTQANPDWSPRGDWVAYDQQGSFPTITDLFVHNVSSGVTQLLFASTDHDLLPAFSPNGQQVAFYRLATSGAWSLARVDLDGSNAATICALPDDNQLSAPRWSPDGQQVYFARHDTLWSVPFTGGTPTAMQPGAEKVREFDFSLGRGPLVVPSRWSYLRCNTPPALNAFQIGLRDSATGFTRPEVRGVPVEMLSPRWSLDGTRVAAGGQSSGQTNDLWLINMTANHAPSMPMADVNVQVGVPLTINLSATDLDGDPITYRAPSRYLPAGATFSGSQFSWTNPTPVGADYFVVFRALDPFGGVANKVVKIHVSGGGSGCPFVDTRTAQGWEVENSILGRSATSAFDLDPYRLKYAPEIVNGKVRLRIRENEQDLTTLDRVQLLAFDHPTGSQVFRLGERTVSATLLPAHRITNSRGTDLTSGFLAGAYQGMPGDTLYVDMTDPSTLRSQATTEGLGPQSTITDGGGGGYMNGFQKDLEPEVRHQLANEGTAAPTDVQVLNETGILIDAPDGRGGWRLVRRYYPREREAECTLDSLGQGSLRLIFIGRHALSYIGRLTDLAAAPDPQVLAMTGARHSRLGAVSSALEAGGTTTTLAPGDTLNLEFAAGAVPQGKVRSYFLLSTGVYTDASSARAPQVAQEQALPAQFALAQNKPNPFARTTTIRFALPVACQVKLEIFDLQGRLVRVLANRTYEPGYHAAEWDRRDQTGSSFGAGVFLYRLRAGSFVEQRKMVLLAH